MFKNLLLVSKISELDMFGGRFISDQFSSSQFCSGLYILLKLGMKFLRYLIVLSLFQTDEMSLKDGKLKFSTSKLRRSVSQSERGFSHRPLHDARMGRGSVTFSNMVDMLGGGGGGGGAPDEEEHEPLLNTR